jgi:hypothetical protein
MLTIKVSELKNKVLELENDNIEYIEICEVNEDIFQGHTFPKSLSFSGLNGEGGCIDYDRIDNVEISSFYKFE